MALKDQGPRPVRQFKPVASIGQYGSTIGELSMPWGVAVTERNVVGPQIAVSDTSNNRIQIFNIDGTSLKTFGSHNNWKSNRQGEFNFPTGIVYHDNGNITVTDTYNHRVQTFSGDGKYLCHFGEEGSLDHQLNAPYGLSLDSEGNIIVADTGNKLIKIFSPSGEFLRKLGGEGSLNSAAHCIQQDQYFIVSDFGDHCIKVFDLKGNYLYKFGKKGDGDGDFGSPRCLALNREGHLVVCDSENHRVQLFEQNGKFLTKFGTHGSEKGQFYYPVCAAVLGDSRIIITDMYNCRIQIFG